MGGECYVSKQETELTMEQLAVLENEMQKQRKSLGLAYVLCIFLEA